MLYVLFHDSISAPWNWKVQRCPSCAACHIKLNLTRLKHLGFDEGSPDGNNPLEIVQIIVSHGIMLVRHGISLSLALFC